MKERFLWEKEIQLKLVRRNRKRKLRSVYKEIKSELKSKLANTCDDDVELKVSTEYRLANFILMKKLEGLGYRCSLERNRNDWRRGRCEDILNVRINQRFSRTRIIKKA